LKLYYVPGACSMVPHIVAKECNLPIELIRVDLRAHTTSDGADFLAINPKGTVPLLELDSGHHLSEGPIIVQYLADLAGNTALMPEPRSMSRYRVMEWQNYITSDVHQSFAPLFDMPDVPAPTKALFIERLRRHFSAIDQRLATQRFLVGDHFSAADAYLFVVANWSRHVGLDLSPHAHLQEFLGRVAQRPSVIAAMHEEGLIPR
jgi:glutathione S-transferase